MDAYITDIASFLPNNPLDNDLLETVLGMINQAPSRTRKIISRNNGIRKRYYAIDPVSGEVTHTNAQLAAEAVKRLKPYDGFTPSHIQTLCCGTSSPDQLMPGHASMVHGEIKGGPLEAVSTAGICLSGITALKYAAMSVALGETENGVATGSELASSYLHARICGTVSPERAEKLEKQPGLSFEADFLRWMLSDGAGAVFLSHKSSPDRPSLRIDWINNTSHAHFMEPCMFAGAVKHSDGSLKGWRQFNSLNEAVSAEAFPVKQDAKLLNDAVLPVLVGRSLPLLISKYNLKPEAITWFLPHYSSKYFRQRLYDSLRDTGLEIPFAHWFTNLSTKGNTGSAAIYIVMEELFNSGRLKQGDTLFCFIPESGRFSVGYMHLTVV